MTITNIEVLAELAGTAQASYGTLSKANLEQDLVRTADFTETEARAFVARYIFIDQQPNTYDGFSAAVFQDKETGKLVLAIRGTEPTAQGFVDILSADFGDIGIIGFAHTQSVDLYRYWRQLTTTGGQGVNYSDDEIEMLANLYAGDISVGAAHDVLVRSMKDKISSDVGRLSNKIPLYLHVDVTGHSLGGNLAYVFSRMFPQNVSQVVTLNAPGLGGQGLLNRLGFSGNADITSIDAEGDLVHYFGGSQLGGIIDISQEVGHDSFSGIGSNHSSINSVDGLNLLKLFSTLDPSESDRPSGILNNFMRASSYQALDTYENMLDGLRKTLLGGDWLTETPDATIDTSDVGKREIYYKNIDELNTELTSGQLKYLVGQVTLVSAAKNYKDAKTDYGQFLSLYFLTPFALKGNELDLKRLNADIYELWKTDRSLSEEDRRNGKANFSDAWYEDRGGMLAALTSRNTADTFNDTETNHGPLSLTYYDVSTDTRVFSQSPSDFNINNNFIKFGDPDGGSVSGDTENDRLYGGKSNDTLSGKEGHDYLEGGAGDDLLYGGDGADQLYGSAGDDQLVGEGGNDILVGGEGTDKYIFTGQFGRDMIKDSDNKGSIEISSKTISTLQQTEKGSIVYLDDINHPTYQAIVVDEGDTKSLIITQLTNSTNSVTIKNWADGNLGITLTQASEPTVAPKVITINGNGGDNILSLDNKKEEDPNLVITGTESLNISGGAGRDLLLGLRAGSDTLNGGDGNDIIIGGNQGNSEYGKDVINGDDGNDYIFSTPLGSVAHGGKGNDFVRADEGAYINTVSVQAAVTNNVSYNAHPALTRDQVWQDVLSIFNYDFYSFGFKSLTENLNEYNSVAGGKFLVEPLDFFKISSDNWITGSNLTYSSRISAFAYDYAKGLVGQHKENWMNLSTPLSYSVYGLGLFGNHSYNDTGATLFGDEGNDAIAGGIYSDELLGGSGNDFIWGGKGNDLLDGGTDNDNLSANEGNDTLIGGQGMDTMSGGDDADMLYGGMDVDELHGDNGDDYLDGGSGADKLDGGDGNNYLFGGDDTDADTLTAGKDNDILVMGKGDTGDAGGGNNIYIWDTHQVTTTNVNSSSSVSSSNSSSSSSANFVMADVGDGNATQSGVQDDTIWVFNSTGNNTLGILGQSDFSGIYTIFSNNVLQLNTQTGQQINIIGVQNNNSVKIVFGNSVEQLAQTPLTNFSLTDDHFLNGIAPLDQTTVTSTDIMLARDEVPEVIAASAANAYLAGSLVNDMLTGHIGGTTFVGGHGDDVFNGDIGNDTYLIRKGDDKDIINEKGGINHIKFDKNITPDQVTVGRNSTDLILAISEEQSVTVKNVFDSLTGKVLVANNIIDLIFYDGTTWDFNALNQRALVPNNANDWMMYGDEKDNTLGFDYPNYDVWKYFGGAGDDVYKFSRGEDYNLFGVQDTSGNDTIELGVGITPDDVRLFHGYGNPLVIRVGNNTEIYIEDAFDSAGNLTSNMIENIKFSNNTMWNFSRIQQEILKDYKFVATGTDEQNWLSGRGGKTIFNAGKGDDYIYGSDKDDVYQYASGDGNDVIRPDPNGNDVIEFTSGILPQDITAKYSGNDLILTIRDGGSITVNDMLVDKESNVLDPLIPIILNNARDWVRQAEKLIEENYGLVADNRLNPNFVSLGQGGVIASVTIMRQDLDSKAEEVTLNIDLDDFQDVPNGKGDIYYDRIIAHEVVHAIMAFTMPTAEMPGWFTEGTAEFIHGGDSRVKNNIAYLSDQNSFNTLFKTTPGEQSTAGYAVSYIAVKLLDREIRNYGGTGIKDIFDLLKEGRSLNESLQLVSLANGINDLWVDLSSFENHFRAIGFINMNSIVNLSDADTGSIAGSDYGNPALDAGDVIPDTIVREGYIHLYLDNPEKYWTNNAQHNAIETIKFSDGTTWDAARIKQAATGVVQGTIGNDSLIGFVGNDSIYGDAGNDTLTGRGGNDILNGDSGDDLFIYGLGDGSDSILESAGTDTISFTNGISEENLVIRRDETNLSLTFGTDEEITVKDMFDSNGVLVSNNAIENIKFANGTIWNFQRIQQEIQKNAPQIIMGTIGDDILTGTINPDVLTGGKGQDTLNGGAGNDIYKYNYGDGNDVINDVSGKDILQLDLMPSKITLLRDRNSSNSFYVSVNGTGAGVRINGGFNIETDTFTENTIEAIKFADGSKWDLARIKAEIIKGDTTIVGTDGNDRFYGTYGYKTTLMGGAGNDTLVGSLFNDVLNGGDGDDLLAGDGGNDILSGGVGNDYLIGEVGNDLLDGGDGADTFDFIDLSGDDTILNAENQDTINLGPFVDVRIENRNDLVFYLSNGSKITVKESVDNNGNIIVSKFFADTNIFESGFLKTTWRPDQINQYIIRTIGTDGNDVLRGSSSNDTFIGGKGNDTLDGLNGDDTYFYNSGDGDDSISDYSGKNEIQFGAGISESDVVVRFSSDRFYFDVYLPNAHISGVRLDAIRFENGVYWDNARVVLEGMKPSQSNDYLVGTSANDTIYAAGGSDLLLGFEGDDTYVINKNNLVLARIQDTSGNNDILQFGEGIQLSDLTVEIGMFDELTINIFPDETIKIINGSIANQSIESVRFYNGETLTQAQLLSMASAYDKPEINKVTGTAGNDIIYGASWKDSINGGAGNDIIYGGTGKDTLLGGLNDDTLYGGAGDDKLDGGDGNDVLFGGEGSNSLVGGAGNDTLTGDGILQGGLGDDTYIPTSGNISDDGGNDTVILPAAITPDNLYLKYEISGNGKDYITFGTVPVTSNGYGNFYFSIDAWDIKNNALVTSRWIETIQFANGAVWKTNDFLDFIPKGTNANDQQMGTSGNDVIASSLGNDQLIGGAGDDIYTYKKGDGNDGIFDLSGNDQLKLLDLLESDVVNIRRSHGPYYDDTGFVINFESSEITSVLQFAEKDGSGNLLPASVGLESIIFADGIVWDINRIKAELIKGTSDNDNIRGFVSNERIDGGAGDDYIDGAGGNDTLIGGSGNDSLLSMSDTTFEGGLGNDNFFNIMGNNIYRFSLGDGQDTINDSKGIDAIEFSSGINKSDISIEPDNNDLIIRIANTTDSIRIFNALVPIKQTNEGGQIEKLLFANGESIVIPLPIVNQVLVGTEGPNSLDGGVGNDSLTGGLGNDYLVGRGGADTYFFNLGDGQDVIEDNDTSSTVSTSKDRLVLGAGITRTNIKFVEINDSTLRMDIGSNGDQITFDRMAESKIEEVLINGELVSFDTLVNDYYANATPTPGNDTLKGNAQKNTIDGLGGNDTISGFDNDDTLLGNLGDDSLIGGAGNDLLDGGAGVDIMLGETGDDIYIVDNTSDIVTENLNEGVDLVKSSITYILGNNLENLTLTGASPINGTGNELNNIILGNSAANTLNGAAGADALYGSAGDDTYIIDNVNDVVVELSGEGTDLVQSSVSYTLAANIEKLTLTNSSNINATGNDLANTINGNAGNNIIDGGAGNDTMIGGSGNDTYIVDNIGDVITEASSGGTDLIKTGISFSLSGLNVENLTLTGSDAINATGNSYVNVIIGNSGANILDGGAGADSLSGGSGDDIYKVDNVGDLVTENVNEGIDLIQSNVTYSLGANIENLTLTDNSAINGTGNNLANILIGNGAVNNLSGGAGDDTLDGGSSGDNLTGGSGNDTYVVDDANDIVTENTGEGTDLVKSKITYTLGNNVENLTLTGTNNINGTGNTLNNYITGNTGANTLNGGTGTDTLAGAAGNDTYFIDDTSDLVIELSGEGTDLVQSSITYTLTANVEKLTLTGASNINATGNDLANSITGNAGNNIIDGGAGVDTMIGGTGDDTYIVDNSSDLVTEASGGGTDLVKSSANYILSNYIENLTLIGNTSINATGNSIANTIIGNGAANILDGASGADSLSGGLGDDTYIVDNTGDLVTENANEGVDLVQSNITYSLGANVENLTLTGSLAINGTGNSLDNILIGNIAVNTLSGGDGNDTLDGGGGADNLSGGLGNDTFIVDHISDVVTENSNAGTDTVLSSISYVLGTNVENLSLIGSSLINATGNAFSNILVGNTNNNILDGAADNDTLNGGLGNDTLKGGTGADTYIYNLGDGEDYIAEYDTSASAATSKDRLQLGSGINRTNIRFSVNSSNNRLTMSIGSNGDQIIFETADANGNNKDAYKIEEVAIAGTVVSLDSLVADYFNGNFQSAPSENGDTLNGTAQPDNIDGLGGNDTIDGKDGNDTLLGSAGNDSLIGGNGADQLDGGIGADTMIGGADNDTYIVDDIGDLVTENSNSGSDTVLSSITYALAANVEHLSLMGSSPINGTGNDLNNNLVGNSAANTLTGAAGNDTLDGAVGADILIGGLGDDVYVIDNTGDVVTENVSEGTDLVTSNITYSLGNNVENLTLLGTGAINGTGNSLNNILIGNDGNNTLDGGAGSDTLSGGAGVDIMIGGIGDDTYIVDNTSDVVTEVSGAGTDLIEASVSYSLNGLFAENLTLTGTAAISATGNSFANTIIGNGLANIIDGAGGVDNLLGGLGDDIYIVDNSSDLVIENLNEGTDLVQSNSTYSLSANVENLTLTGSLAINGTGNNLANILIGNAAVNNLTGGDGDDTLDGGGSGDNLTGGLGNDTYVVDNNSDVVTENLGEGVDLVKSFITYTLGNNVENLTLTGTSLINGTGNALNNFITGNSVANTLNGGTGTDTLSGAAGDDTYFIDDASDLVIELSGEGTDLVQSSTTYTLTANVEKLTLTGTANINATGNDLANTITGNAGNNLIDGGAGIDTMIGGTGDDTYVVDNAGDLITESASAGTDLVLASVSYSLASTQLENLTLTGTSATNAVGNSFANTLIGNIAANTLDGSTGADNLIGGLGDDTYIIDNIGDLVTENANEGIDLVKANITYTLGANVENLTLTGASSIHGTGNSLNNFIIGTSASNTLNGAAGADTLSGAAGDDTYVVDDIGDLVIEQSGEGTDIVQSSIAYTLTANVERLTLTGTDAISGTGNDLANSLTGNSGDNLLDGGAGIDTMTGGAGNDTYIVDSTSDVVTEASGAGTDVVKSSANYTLSNYVENLTLTGSTSINATGNSMANTIFGNSASNILDGASGADSLSGGLGDDTYIVDNVGDVVTENANEGTDLVKSTITYTLGANLENLTLTGSLAANGTGNALNNVLTGNSDINNLIGNEGNDTLDGGSSNDNLTGGVGNDTYLMGRGYASDSITENDSTSGNTDVVQFGTDISIEQLWFKHVGNNLEAYIVGTTDKLVVNNWYSGSNYQTEQFKTADGKVLLNTQVEALVSAMASFAAPVGAGATVSQQAHDQLQPVLAANWH